MFKILSLEANNENPYDLVEQTLKFARDAKEYVDKLPQEVTNTEIGRQLIRAAGSVGANYIETDEVLSRKDFIMRIRYAEKRQKRENIGLNSAHPIMKIKN